MQIELPKELNKLAGILSKPLYVVGGYIRNFLLGIEKEDIDICSQLLPEEVAKELKGSEYKVKIKSKILGSALISIGSMTFEYTTFRRDIYPSGGNHMPDKVEFVSSPEEDAKRRDFTCNALYYDILNDKILDFYGGASDIKKKILRTVETPDKVLCHDGVRILRLFRFECELNLKLKSRPCKRRLNTVKTCATSQANEQSMKLQEFSIAPINTQAIQSRMLT